MKSIVFILTFLNTSLWSQSLYDKKEHPKYLDLNWKMDAPLLLGGVSAVIAGDYFIKKLTPLSDNAIASLNTNDINSFDRSAALRLNFKDADLSDVLLRIAILSPLTLATSKSVIKEPLPVLVVYIEAGMIVYGLTHITKGLSKRIRPYAYNPNVSVNAKKSLSARQSFFSGHVSASATAAFTTAYLLQTYSNKRWVKTAAWVIAGSLPAAVGYLRYSSGKHFATDIITGYLVGAGIGLVVPMIHKNKNPEKAKTSLKFNLSSNGIGLTYNL